MKRKNKLELSSYLGNSWLDNGSNSSFNQSEGEERCRNFEESKHSEKHKRCLLIKKSYESESSVGEGEASSSFNLSKHHQRKHSNQQDDIVNKKSFDKATSDNKPKEFDKHILINEKFNIEIDNTYGNKLSISKNDDSKLSSNKWTIKSENKNIDIGYKCFNLDDLMVKREETKSDQVSEKNLPQDNFNYASSHSNTPSQEQFGGNSKAHSKEKREERKSIKSTENNNLDLHSVRYKSNDFSDEKPNIEIDIRNDEYSDPLLFSDLSKWLNENKKQILSNTFDQAWLAKLRRMIGSEKLIREYRTSEESSHFQYVPHLDENPSHSDHYDHYDVMEGTKSKDSFKDLKLKLNADLDNENEPIELLYNLHEDNQASANITEDFMGTNELIDLFTSEGIKKTIESGEYNSEEKMHTQTLFERNPFKDFTMTKIHEMLVNKDHDEMQELRKIAIDYRASIENKLLSKINSKESPKTIKSRRLDIEKWVDQELYEVDNEIDEDRMRQKTIQTIWDTNIHTERIFSLIQRINLTESNVSSIQQNQDRVFEKKTIDELLKTDSDTSPNDDRFDFYHNQKIFRQKSIEEASLSDNEVYNRLQTNESNKTDEMDIWETTQELLSKNFDNIIKSKYGIQVSESDEKNNDSERDADSVLTFKPKEHDDKNSNLKDSYINDDSINGIFANEVNLEQSDQQDTSEENMLYQQTIESEKILISEEISGHIFYFT